MTTIAEYNKRKFVIDECRQITCRVCVIDENGCGHIYINREDAENAIETLQAFIRSPRWKT